MIEIPFKYGWIVLDKEEKPDDISIKEFKDMAKFIFDQNNNFDKHYIPVQKEGIIRTGKFITYRTIINIVFDYFQVYADFIKKDQEQVLPRQVSMKFGKNYTKLSLEMLGKPFGKDHTTVLHSIKRINEIQFNKEGKDFDIIKALKEIETKIINCKTI
jgi:chromosomal replication initiation ATPase DnaA